MDRHLQVVVSMFNDSIVYIQDPFLNSRVLGVASQVESSGSGTGSLPNGRICLGIGKRIAAGTGMTCIYVTEAEKPISGYVKW